MTQIDIQPLQWLEDHMVYSKDHPVRLVGGRLALDLVNTADWSADDQVVQEKIADFEDLEVWLRSLELETVEPPRSIAAFHALRRDLRAFIRSDGTFQSPHLRAALGSLRQAERYTDQSLTALATMSAISIMADPRERDRIKMCPGVDCGWLFIDETRNSRRTWCLMETCGNKAKAARHYEKVRRDRSKT